MTAAASANALSRWSEATLHQELGHGERLVWASQPRIAALVGRGLPLALFGVPFFGFAVFWTCMAVWMTSGVQSATPPSPAALRYVFPLFGIPFLLIGAAMLLSPAGMWIKARRTVYGLTNQRAIVVLGTLRGGWEVRSYRPADLRHITRIENSDGSGDLIFDRVVAPRSARGRGRWLPPIRRMGLGFMCIRDVHEVERVVRQTLDLS